MTWFSAFGELPAYLATGFALAMLGGSIGFALRRGAPGQAVHSSTDRTARILGPSLLFSGGMSAFFAILFAGRTQLSALLFGSLLLTAATLIFVALFDLSAMRIGATRVRRWLIIGIALFVSPYFILLVATSGIGETLRSFDALGGGMLALAAALVWWSFLPPELHDLAGPFE